MSGTTRLTAAVVGAGPVACLVAIGLRAQSFEVDLYERGPDIRRAEGGRGHSFNLTLTKRGLGSLDPAVVDLLYANGVPLPQRVIHAGDGSVSYQPYSLDPDHHLLSIPRGLLHRILLDEAERAGARIHFEHDCVSVDPVAGAATFVADTMVRVEADLLVGCDGANSTVRHEISRRGSRMTIHQEYVRDGFVEIVVPAAEDGGHALLRQLRDPATPESLVHGLHVWPRGDFMLLAQPNVDGTYTAGLWMPMTADGDAPDWRTLSGRAEVEALFAEHFADLVPLAPGFADDVLRFPPAPLKTLRCGPYHHGKTVLLGDSAHTLVPFFGQGINCSFEDVRTFLALLEANRNRADGPAAIAAALPEYTRLRKPAGDAIADLSLAMARELKNRTGDPGFRARSALEKVLHATHPDLYVPLYHAVAFTDSPYHEVVARHRRQRAVLDDLCRRHDPSTDRDLIIAEYAAVLGAGAAVPAPRHEDEHVRATASLDLGPARQRALLDAVSARLADYHEDLAKRNFPASYPATDTQGPSPLPECGTDLPALLDELFDTAMPQGMMHAHPGFLAHVPSGGLFQGAVGEFLARALNRFAGAWAAAPGFARMETDVIDWFCRIMGYGSGSFGYLTTGGSIANFMALRCALERVPEHDRHRARVYVSDQGHFSVAKAAKLAGLPADRVVVVPTGADHRMDVDALRSAILADARAGDPPGCVVATAGTTNTGAVDDIRALAAVAAEHGVWLHVDACFGGFFRLTARGRELLAGTELADSIAVDAHKSLFLPHGSSALLVREKAALRAAFAIPGAAYIPELSTDEDTADFMNYGPEVTREFRGLTAWLPLRLHGAVAFERGLDHKLDLADELAARLAALPGVAVVDRAAPHLPTVAFRVRNSDAATAELCERVCARGNVYVATSVLPREGTVVRACLTHHLTDELVVDQFVEDVQSAMQRLEKETAS
ncbi:aminotransferase class V-fold PLP-dependent enzyme [Actinokineospora sp. PR83]|uniref:aminotransferase class V-fold PLP-dependent enzyme n=1 Tax=Actinokineospora sp. PR83 TaxID=2884908 RepID=UPI001F208B51|nr:aminotransferase class V-fold PLP-dependent enzyme [Actinokineospora sp. PR83]MCG8917239.1 aminotransferase class V-fold PLP-dependent enzyme [Actinokineospora sp. PR83]